MASKSATSAPNRLLASLPNKDKQHFLSGCEEVELVMGDILAEPGQTIPYVYFPNGSFISLVMSIDSGASLEVGLVGNEGMYGTPLLLGVERAPFHVLVQGTGPALRMSAPLFMEELEQSAQLSRKLKRYFYVATLQLARAAACNRFHLVEQRLARWLLMTQDRAHSNQFHITQEFLSQMLGVRRVGVTRAAVSLQKRKLISYSRGEVQILDEVGLEAASCSCYRADCDMYTKILRC